MIRRTAISTVAAAAIAIFGGAGAADAAFPERPITMLVPWNAGGGTDATARIVATLLEKELGVPVNVVNRTGGSGVVGHTALATAPADGYTIGIITVEIGMMHYQGLTTLDGTSYSPLGLMNQDPPGVNVVADAKWADLKAFMDDVKAAPKGEFKASGTGQGGIWHVALGGMLQAAGLAPDHIQWIPSQGAAPGLQDMLSGGVQVVPSSVPEAKALIDAGRVKSLAIMAPERNPIFPDVPTVQESIGIDFTIGAWRGFAGPPNLSQEAIDRLVPALEKISKDAEFTGFMANRGFGIKYLPPTEFAGFMAEQDAMFGKIMPALGLAK